MKKTVLAALSFALIVGMMVLVGCSCSSNAASSSSASSSSASASSSSSSSSASSSSSSSSSAAAKDVVVPDLKGKTQADAEKALSDLKLVGVASNPEETTEVEAGKVFKQSIAAGTTVKEGEKIAFTVALAPAEVTVPDVVGKTRDEAKEAITGARLNFDDTVAYDDNVAEGNVISQSADAGSKLQAGTTVSVVVSLGAKPVQDVEVPNLLTYSREEAQSTLDSAGLKASFVGDQGGSVVSQDVPAGTKVAPGTTVTMTLEEGGQNPIMNFIGLYGAEKATIKVDAAGSEDGKITVEWSVSASERSEWTMSGHFDSDKLTLHYTNGVKTNIVHGENGAVKSEEIEYEDGTGTFQFSNDGTLTWKDDVENIAKGVVFKYVSLT